MWYCTKCRFIRYWGSEQCKWNKSGVQTGIQLPHLYWSISCKLCLQEKLDSKMRVKVLPTVNIFITLQSILCWIKLTQGEGDISVKNSTDVSCEFTFSRNLEKCLKLSKFYKFLSTDGVKNNLMVALFLDFHCR